MDNYFEEIVGRVFERYEAALRRNGAVDFDDLLGRTLEMFEAHPEIQERYAERYLHTLVDEFQDTNLVQYQLARALSSVHHNLTVVGDPDQSIYSWRAADIRNLLNFEEDFPGATTVLLEQNYRSTGHILRVAHGVISKAEGRPEKDLWTSNPDGERVVEYEATYGEEEAQFIAGEIQRLLDTCTTTAGYKLADDYRKALQWEPMRLVEHIVRNDKPFTEIVTADYIMVTPYSSRGYGIYEEIKDRFKDTKDPLEYIPVKLKALVGREKSQNQESPTGFYPHAGLLSNFQYLRRYPTTETNRNRQRSRVFYQHFLGVDVLELAARVGDAAAVQAKFENPTMQASECVVCHKTLDPVAGLFQDYWRFADQGIYGRRKGGWFTDMFAAGYEGEDLPGDERWRALQWLGERTAKDPRFAGAMVEHAYYILTGRKVLLPPKDLDDPLYARDIGRVGAGDMDDARHVREGVSWRRAR